MMGELPGDAVHQNGSECSSGTEYIVNCRKCGFSSIEPDIQNADRVRDDHEMEMFNWRAESKSCGPCAVAPIHTTTDGE